MGQRHPLVLELVVFLSRSGEGGHKKKAIPLWKETLISWRLEGWSRGKLYLSLERSLNIMATGEGGHEKNAIPLWTEALISWRLEMVVTRKPLSLFGKKP